jgi:hypothetical protein
VTNPDGQKIKITSPAQELRYDYKPSKSGNLTFTFDVPELGMKKDVTISVAQYVAIPPTVTFTPKSVTSIKVGEKVKKEIGILSIYPKNQTLFVKDFEFNVISSDYNISDVSLVTYWNGSGKIATDGVINTENNMYLQGDRVDFVIYAFPEFKPFTKAGKFKVKVSNITFISNFNGNRNENNIPVDVSSFVSEEITVTP